MRLDAKPPLVLTDFWLLADTDNSSSSCSSSALASHTGSAQAVNATDTGTLCSLDSSSESRALFALQQTGPRSFDLLLVAPLASTRSAHASISYVSRPAGYLELRLNHLRRTRSCNLCISSLGSCLDSIRFTLPVECVPPSASAAAVVCAEAAASVDERVAASNESSSAPCADASVC